MPVQIGAKSHHFTEPLGLLSDCHRRIEMFLGSLSAIANVAGPPLSEEGRRALEKALRYFRESAPKHSADEEQSLFPRLTAQPSKESDTVLATMKELEKEHRWAESLHAEVDRLGQKYLTDGSLSDRDSAEYRNAMDALSAMYRRHIKIEDESLFPFAAKALSQADKLAIAAEMAARRETGR